MFVRHSLRALNDFVTSLTNESFQILAPGLWLVQGVDSGHRGPGLWWAQGVDSWHRGPGLWWAQGVDSWHTWAVLGAWLSSQYDER